MNPTITPEQAKEQAERARKQAEEARARGAKLVERAEKESEQQSLAVLKRMESSRPTPTQHELNLANVGALDMSTPKEDDGSGPEMVHVRTIVPVTELDESGRYQTRSMNPAVGAPAQPRPPRPATPTS
jgi:sRNA-binding protein